MSPLKEIFQHAIFGHLKYDRREKFTLSDGGKIFLDYMGDSFREGDYFTNSRRPILIIVPGIGQSNEDAPVENLVRAAHYENGFDCVVINSRGLAGAKLETPNVSSFYSCNDYMEAMKHIYNTYAKEKEKQVFAIGFSKGAHHLTNVLGLLGEESFITAACVL